MLAASRALGRALACVVAALCLCLASPAAEGVRFDVNDTAFLWPPPASAADVAALIPGTELLDGTDSRIWPKQEFDLLRGTAENTIVMSSAGTPSQIDFTPFKQDFERGETWKVVGVRVDPSAPGSHPSLIAQFGSTPQIRLIMQPVTVRDGVVKVHDVTAHLAYSFITGVDAQTRMPIPNKVVFAEIVEELAALKALAGRAGVETAGPLRVHPALAQKRPEFNAALRTFLKRRLAQGRLTEMAFMGIDPPEPWIFFAMVRRPDGAFVQIGPPSLGGQSAQMLILRGGSPVMPSPQTTNVTGKSGVSTAPLFRANMTSGLQRTPAIPGTARPLHADIPDIIANPRLSTVRNTDCVSCHTESTRRAILRLASSDPSIAFQRPANVSGVDPGHLPQSPWNVRNFGWFQGSDGRILPTITMRTANEVAEAVAFLNSEHSATLAPTPAETDIEGTVGPPQQPVASDLTLVMTIKSPKDFAAVKRLLEKIQGMPREENPIWRALTKLSTVHFARFVFLNERQLAVITTYDGTFEDYIDAFVNTIGGVFDQLLAHMADAPRLPVSEHRGEFLDYVRRNDLKSVPPFYSAYPNLKVLDILTLEKERRQ